MKKQGAYSNALYAKCKAINAKRITNKQLEELSQLSNLSEFSSYLKNNTSYSEAFSGIESVNFRKDRAEGVLYRMTLLRFLHMSKYMSQGTNQQSYFLGKIEADFIISCAKRLETSYISDPFLTYVPEKIKSSLCLSYNNLIKSDNPESFMQALSGTPYEKLILKVHSDSQINLAMLQNALYKRLLENTYFLLCGKDGKNNAELGKLLCSISDIYMISGLVRAKRYYPENTSALLSVFRSSLSNITEKQTETLIFAKDEKKLLEEMSQIKKLSDIYKRINSKNLENEALYALFRKTFSKTTDALCAAVSYFELSRLECKNLTAIAGGISAHLDASLIMSLLVKE